MFDFDQLSEEETAAPSDGDSRTSGTSPSPDATSTESEIRRCQGHGLCITWGPEKHQMVAMLLEVETWQRYGICALKEECGKRRIPVDGLYERRDVLERLETVLVWQHMSLKQLQSECWRRRIPYIPQKRVSHILLLETENPHADEHGDLLRRLMQDAYPGATGPLPLGGVAGVWTPGAGSFTAGGVRLPAWTGASAPGFEETGTVPPPASAPKGVPNQARRPPRSSSGTTGTAGTSTNGRSRFFESSRSSCAFPEVHLEDHPGAAHFRELGLLPTSNIHEVRKAYRQLALKYHPDKGKELDDTTFKKITQAYKALCELLQV